MKKRIIRIAIVAFWGVMMAWLVRYEAFPEYFTHTISGYGSLLSEDILLEDSWMRILFNGKPIGYSHSGVDVDETNPARHYTVNGSVHMKLNLLGTEQDVHVDTTAIVDVLSNLRSFSFHLFAKDYALRLRALRKQGTVYNVEISTGTSKQRTQIEIPDDVIVYSPMTDMAVRKLRPGQELSIKTFDPSTLSTVRIVIRALRREKLIVGGVEYDATVLSAEYGGARVISWIDEDGISLRQETPFGWVLERCTSDEAFAALKEAAGSEDMLARMAVKCDTALEDPLHSEGYLLRFVGVGFTREELDTHRQEVRELEDRTAVVMIRRDSVPKPGEAGGPDAEAPDPRFLAASPFIQSDHPDLIRQAEKIVGDEIDPLKKALAIFRWVHRNVEKQMTVSLPSALDVLRTMAGDCNEHTYLQVGLCRAAGIPSRVVFGVAYQNGAFYYHAWPAVYVGRWLEMDPTWGQEAVDATHIALAEGELAGQLDLMKILGQLRIEVVEEKPKHQTQT